MQEPYRESMTETGGVVENNRDHSDHFSGTGLGLCKSMELSGRLKILERLASASSAVKGRNPLHGASLEDAF